MDLIEITPEHPSWPQGLRALGDRMPQKLWVRGDVAALALPGIACVGSRASTSYGEHVAAHVAEAAVAHGHAVVSGLASGIDGAAHRAAVNAGGVTVAYLACGVDRIYPQAHTGLASEIVASGGAIASAYEPGAPPSKFQFLERNGLIAAHSEQLVVAEAGRPSGSLNAVGHAERMGRTVWSVPGPVTSAASYGTNTLIAEGRARLLLSGEYLFA